MKITIEEKGYEIDIQRAKELGLCKEVRKEIIDINAGDVFEAPWGERVLIVEVKRGFKSSGSKFYNIAGFDGLEFFSYFGSKPHDYKEMMEWLNKYKYTFIANINLDVKELIKNVKKLG
jgi:hypothetical protein